MTRQLGLSIAAGLLSALLFVSMAKGIALGLLLSYIAPLPLMMAALGMGTVAALVGSGVGALAVATVAGEFSALPYLVVAAVPAVVVANRALLWRTSPTGITEWYPPGLVLAWLTATGLVLLLIGVALLSGSPEGIEAWVAHVIDRALSLMAPEAPAEQRQQAVRFWQWIFPAAIVGSWLGMAVLNAIGAQGLLVRSGHSRRPTPAYRELMLPDWMGLVLLVSAVVAMAADGDVGYVAFGVMLVMLLPFALLGLAAIHVWVHGRSNARFVLAVTYGLLILASGLALIALTGPGLVRFWTMRFRRPDSGGGMEG